MAIGNRFRGDDGVGHRVLQLLGPGPGRKRLACRQPAPELAESLAGAETVVFVDADAVPGEVAPRLEELGEDSGRPRVLSHALPPAAVVALARRLYGFRGRAWLCRVPAHAFGDGRGLSPEAERGARRAACLLRRWLQQATSPF